VVAIESKAPFRHSAGRTTVNLGEGEIWTQVLSITEYNPTDLDGRRNVYKSKWVLYDHFRKSKKSKMMYSTRYYRQEQNAKFAKRSYDLPT